MATNRSTEFLEVVGAAQWNSVVQGLSPEQQFLNHHWYNVWCKQYLPIEHPHSLLTYVSIAEEYQGKFRQNGIFPCVAYRRLGVQILSTAGYYYPFRTFLSRPGNMVSNVSRFVDAVHDTSAASVVRIGPVEETDPICEALEQSFSRKGWLLFDDEVGQQQMVCLPSTLEQFRQSLSKNLRKNHARRIRQLQAAGKMEIVHYNDCGHQRWEQAIDQCALVESRCWLNNDAGGKMRIYLREDFWKRYLDCPDARRRVSIWVVVFDGKPISYSLSLDAGESRFSISGQYDEAYKKYGAGIIADMCMFENAVEKGVKVVNMGDGESSYKSRWGASPGPVLKEYLYFRKSLVGLAAWIAHAGIEKFCSLRRG